MQPLLRAIFVLLVLSLVAFFAYEGYQSNFSLAKTKEPLEILSVALFAGSFFIVPLLVGVICSLAIAPKDLPWVLLILLGLGAWIQSALHANFLYILIWLVNVGLCCFIAFRCVSKFKVRNEATS